MERCSAHGTLRYDARKFSRAAAFAAVALSMTSCCEAASEPCTPWLREGETYRVELLSHFDSQDDDSPRPVFPYENYNAHEQSCGTGDLEVGSLLLLTAHEETKRNQPAYCEGDCFHHRATAEVDGVSVEEDLPRLPHPVGSDEFYGRSIAMLGENCQVTYDIGLAAVGQYFIEHSDEPVETNYMLFRSITIDPTFADACRAFIPVSDLGLCWDSWSVNVRDPNGDLLSMSLGSDAANAEN